MEDIERHPQRSVVIETTPPLPADGPILLIEDAAGYLRMTPSALRQALKGYDNPDLARELHSLLVKKSPRRRYFDRARFLEWLKNG